MLVPSLVVNLGMTCSFRLGPHPGDSCLEHHNMSGIEHCDSAAGPRRHGGQPATKRSMIARLVGNLVETSPDSAVIDVRGVGYLVLASGKTLAALPAPGGEIILLTELQVRED